MPKQVYTWGKVQTGDIISFRYTGKKSTGTLTTLLVLNPRIPFNKKDGSKSQHLVGLKLESRGNVPTIRAKPAVVQLLENIGNIELVSADDGIYRLNLPDTGPRGVKKDVYRNLKRLIKRYGVYRTYDLIEAKKSAVFLEPIMLPKEVMEALNET
tara:strand:- start:273 stop:737 length:465 start_codon:yes stop_codon:yes gene_type:complete